MKSLFGEDVGTRIDFRSDIGEVDARHPWPDDTVVSAGRGLVIGRRGQPSYRTLFVEVYPPGAAFIRGEGATPQECEDTAWGKYQLALHCTQPDGHVWEARGYRNGAGFCAHCNTFASEVFTGEQLGQHCHVCGTGTTWHWETHPEGVRFFCAAHVPAVRQPPEGILGELFAAFERPIPDE